MYELLGKKKVVEGLFGIEVEVEGKHLPKEDFSNWELDFNEGSLRDGGLEYLFKKPLDYKEALEEIEVLERYILREGGKPEFSPRTSVHVHVNVTDLTFNQMCNFLFLSFLFENNLAHFCGDLRKGNPFCITGKSAEGVYDALEGVFTEKKVLGKLAEKNYRYGFINLASTSKYGSVEFRGMYGTFDRVVLGKWLSTLEMLKEYSKEREFVSPLSIIEYIKRRGDVAFLNGMLTPDFRYEGDGKDFTNTYDMLRTVALGVESWEDVKKKERGEGNPFFNALVAA